MEELPELKQLEKDNRIQQQQQSEAAYIILQVTLLLLVQVFKIFIDC